MINFKKALVLSILIELLIQASIHKHDNSFSAKATLTAIRTNLKNTAYYAVTVIYLII